MRSIAALEKTRDDFAKAYGEEGAPATVMDVAAARGTLAEVITFATA